MSKQRIATSLAPEVFLDQVAGNLQVKGWDEPEVAVQANPTDLKMVEQEDVIHLNCDSDCEVRLPSGAALQIGQAHGEARVRLLEDSLNIQTVHGSLYLRNVAEATIDTVHGELSARQVAGDLKVDKVHGNAFVRDVQGQCLLEMVGGNLDARDVDGDIRAVVGGNTRLRLNLLSGSQYEIQAGGNVHCRIPSDASVRLELTSGGQSISVKTEDGGKFYQQGNYEVVLGTGDSVMTISAGGTIFVFARDSGDDDERASNADENVHYPDDFSEQIARQVEAQIESQMEMMNRQLNEQMATLTASIGNAGLTPEETQRIMERARERSERASAQAQEKMRRAQEKIERKLETARRRDEQRTQQSSWGVRYGRGAWHVNFPAPPPPPPSAAPKEAVSDEERLTILRMLEQKKITIDEAEKLLAALEGKER